MKAINWLLALAVAAIVLLPWPLMFFGVPVGVVLGISLAIGLVLGIRFMLVDANTILNNFFWSTFIIFLIISNIDMINSISYGAHHSAWQLINLASKAIGLSAAGVFIPAAARSFARRAVRNPRYGVFLVAAPVLGFVLKGIPVLPLLPGILLGGLSGMLFLSFLDERAATKDAINSIIANLAEWCLLFYITIEAIIFSTESRSLTAAASAFSAMYVTDTVLRKIRQYRAEKLVVQQ